MKWSWSRLFSGAAENIAATPTLDSGRVGDSPGYQGIEPGPGCRICGERLDRPAPDVVVPADVTAECTRCADAEIARLLAAGCRAVESFDALLDPREVMLRGEAI